MASRDRELAQRCRLGDPGAYMELVHHHRRMVYRVARAITGCPDDAEDVAQEAFLRAYGAIDQYNGHHEFAGWLRRITVNCAISRLRQQKRRARLADEAHRMGQIAPAPDPLDCASTTDLQAHLQCAVDELPHKQRAAITLFALRDMTLAETADAMGCSISAVKAHVHRARRKLAARLSDLLQEE